MWSEIIISNNKVQFNEFTGNIFSEFCDKEFDAICITTNGYYTDRCKAVMGRGCALTASCIDTSLEDILGYKLYKKGNRVHLLRKNFKSLKKGYTPSLLSFPIKPSIGSDVSTVVEHLKGMYGSVGKGVVGYAVRAELGIIERSCIELVKTVDLNGWDNVALPRPGCGAGELKWKEVKKILSKYLDSRFTIVTLP